MPYDSVCLLKQVLFKVYLEQDFRAADMYVRKKKSFPIFDDHIWYSMNKLSFVEEVNVLAICDIIQRLIFWRQRIETIMGYVPYAEFFEINSGLSKNKRIREFFESDKVGSITRAL